MSQFNIALSGLAINKHVYIKSCLKAGLIPSIRSVHESDNIIFWPDLVSAHYSKETQNFLKNNNIELLPKNVNPANSSEILPIEDFWSEIKRLVYANC